MKVKIINTSNHPTPAYATSQSAGMDLRANLEGSLELSPGDRVLVPTGIKIELPAGYEAQIRPRSGMAYSHGITVLNAPGTVDADYRGEVKVMLYNAGRNHFLLVNGDRIAQMVIARHEQVEWVQSESLTDTERGAGGHGSTGVK